MEEIQKRKLEFDVDIDHRVPKVIPND